MSRSFIRLRRVLLLRSYIRLSPSGIRFASFIENKITLRLQGFNITFSLTKGEKYFIMIIVYYG